MEMKEILNKAEAELRRQLGELSEELRDLRFKSSQGQLKHVRRIRAVKRDRARILTVLSAKKEKSRA